MPSPKGSSAYKRHAAAKKAKAKGVKTGQPRAQPIQSIKMKEERFVEILLADPRQNATKAAIAVGYLSMPSRQAGRMLNRPRVKELIAARLGPKMRELEITKERVLQGLAEIAFGNIMDFGEVTSDGEFNITFAKMDRVSAGALAGIKVTTMSRETRKSGPDKRGRVVVRTEIKLADRRPALEALARYLRLLGSEDDGVPQEPIRLIIEHAPPLRPQEPLNVTNLIEEPRR